ncbi:MAG: TIGR02757 family protein, partial [Thermodesulfobacteriota bacterium]
GSLYRLFLSGMKKEDKTILDPLNRFSFRLMEASNFKTGHLIALPERGSPCKRMNLFLRWMVRKDEIDPGGWDEIPPSKLIVPLDTHLHSVSIALGLTCRKQANLKTALEITNRFKTISPEDPVRYDFSLTRFGIRSELSPSDLFNFCEGTDIQNVEFDSA